MADTCVYGHVLTQQDCVSCGHSLWIHGNICEWGTGIGNQKPCDCKLGPCPICYQVARQYKCNMCEHRDSTLVLLWNHYQLMHSEKLSETGR